MSTTGKRVTNVLMTCSSDSEVGGVQTLFRDLVHSLEKTGRHVHLIYPAPLTSIRLVEKTNSWGRAAFWCPMPAVVRNSILLSLALFVLYVPLTFVHLARLIRRKNIDAINCHFLAPYFIHLAIAARLLRVPLVVSVHGSDIAHDAEGSWTQRFLHRTIMRSADHIVACSEALAKQCAGVFPDASPKITWVYSALDDSQQTEVSEVPVSRPFVLCVCRHVHVKGVDVLLKAFALMHREVPDVSLVLVGDGPLLTEQKALAARLGIAHQVVFKGEVAHSDVPGFFAHCELFVLPSRSEGFSITLMEAAYHGRPIVCTRVGGSPELISHGINGLLIEPDDPAAMAAQMLAMLRDEEFARRLGEAARETVRTRFLWRDRIQDYIDVYEGRPGLSFVARLAPETPAPAFTASSRRSSSAIGYARQPDMRSIGSRERIGTELMSNSGKRATNVLMTCASDAEIGGVQTLFRDLIDWLEKNDRRVHIVYPARLPGLRPVEKTNAWGRSASYVAMPALVRNHPLASVPIFLAYAPITFFNLASLIRKEKIDVINCHYLAPYFIHLVIAARLLGVPLVVSVVGSDITSYPRAGWAHRFLYRRIMRSAHRIVACSQALASRTSDAFPGLGAKITWVYCALDESQHTEVREPTGVSPPFVLCVCRHVHVKGVDVLLNAFALIHNEVPDVSLVFVGDGPLLSDQKALAARLGIGHRVMFKGEVAHSDVPGFFSKCALFILPSRSEGFSITLLEAAYHGRPIVCTRVGGSPELISNGINGLLVEPDDPDAMAAQMLTMLRNQELARRLGQAARETVRARFLWRDRIQDYIDIYEGRPGPSLAARSEASQPALRHHEQVASVDPR